MWEDTKLGVRVNGQDGSAIHPVTTLFFGSGAVAVFAAIADVAWLAGSYGLGRLSDLSLFWILHRLNTVSDLSAVLPVLAKKPFDLTNAMSFLSFLPLAIITNLLLVWTLATLLSPAVAAAARIFPQGVGNRLAGWLWGSAYPLGVLVGFAVPVLLRPLHYDLGWKRGAAMGGMVAIGAVIWFGLLVMLRRPRRIRQLLRVCTVFSIAMTILTFSSGAATMVLRSTQSQSAQPTPTQRFPNILLISIDSLRADHLHCYGYPRETSPAIDALAAEGVLFKTVVAPTSWTLPSHLTLLTSLPPEEHGVVDDGMRLGPKVLSLAEVLLQAGYTTAAIVAGPYLRAEYGFSRGFDHYDDYNLASPLPEFSRRGSRSPDQFRYFKDWLTRWDEGGSQRPFFLFLHMWDVHYDYVPPPPFDSLFDSDYQGPVTGENFAEVAHAQGGLNRRDLEHVIALYDGEIRFTDLHIGQILNTLKARGVFDNTIVIVTADHGEEFLEHGGLGHGTTLYDETILVPLVIRFPGKVPMGKVVEQQVRLMDVALTILGLAGVAPPADFGTAEPKGPHAERDLRPLILGDSLTESPRLAGFSHLVAPRRFSSHGPVGHASLRTSSSKLIEHLGDPATYELYDLLTDPAERENLIGTKQGVAARLRQELSAWREIRHAREGHSQEIELSEEQMERLRSLGYIE